MMIYFPTAFLNASRMIIKIGKRTLMYEKT